MAKKIIVTTMNDLPGKQIKEVIGIVRGNTVRSRNLGRDIMATLKNIVGGEIKTYTELITQARDEAYNRMVNNAIKIFRAFNPNASIGEMFFSENRRRHNRLFFIF